MNNFYTFFLLYLGLYLISCNSSSHRNADLTIDETIYRPDSSFLTREIQESIDTINWIELRYVDLSITIKIPSYWKKVTAQYPIISAYVDTSNKSIFRPTYSLKILYQIKSLDVYRKYKLTMHPENMFIIENKPNPYFWTENVYTSFLIGASKENRNTTLSSWSFAFIHRGNMLEINLLTDTACIEEMDLLFKNIISHVDSTAL